MLEWEPRRKYMNGDKFSLATEENTNRDRFA